jgi:hypothetical protein
MTLKSACAAPFPLIMLFLLVAPATAQDTDAAALAEGPIVKLLEQGASPRQELRVVPAKGSKQSSLMTMKIDQTMIMSGRKLPTTPTPAIQFAIDVVITDVATNGDVTMNYEYPKFEIIDESNKPSPAKAMMATMLKSMEGLSGSATISNRGFTRKSEMTLPPDVEPRIKAVMSSMNESMSRMSSPLPEEPVGGGAKWSVTQLIESNGMKIKQTSVHTLKEINGSVVDIAIEVTQTADAQEIKAPGMPPGVTTKLLSLESTGEGIMQFQGTVLFPVSTLKFESKMGMETIAGGQTIPMQVEMTMEMQVK